LAILVEATQSKSGMVGEGVEAAAGMLWFLFVGHKVACNDRE
jgi:hypothetical protein